MPPFSEEHIFPHTSSRDGSTGHWRPSNWEGQRYEQISNSQEDICTEPSATIQLSVASEVDITSVTPRPPRSTEIKQLLTHQADHAITTHCQTEGCWTSAFSEAQERILKAKAEESEAQAREVGERHAENWYRLTTQNSQRRNVAPANTSNIQSYFPGTGALAYSTTSQTTSFAPPHPSLVLGSSGTQNFTSGSYQTSRNNIYETTFLPLVSPALILKFNVPPPKDSCSASDKCSSSDGCSPSAQSSCGADEENTCQ